MVAHRWQKYLRGLSSTLASVNRHRGHVSALLVSFVAMVNAPKGSGQSASVPEAVTAGNVSAFALGAGVARHRLRAAFRFRDGCFTSTPFASSHALMARRICSLSSTPSRVLIASSRDGLTLCQPAADEHVQSLQLRNRRGDHYAFPLKKRRCAAFCPS